MDIRPKSREKPVVLTIAGLDPSSGAGLTADIRTFENIGVYGMSVCTAITVQTAEKAYEWIPIEPDEIKKQADTLFSYYDIQFVKTGMLGSRDVIDIVIELKKKHGFTLIVDPVVYSGSGLRLAMEGYEEAIKTKLIPVADVITPNRIEAENLSGLKITDALSVQPVCVALADIGCSTIIIKGGHIDEKGLNVVDYLYTEGYFRFYPRERVLDVDTPHIHGTGCVFSSLITGFLSLGYDPEESIFFTEDFMEKTFRKVFPLRKGVVLDTGYTNSEIDVLMAVQKVVDFLCKKPEFTKFIPEVRTNVSISKVDAKKLNDVAAVDGRITVVNGKPTAAGPIQFGASNHTGRLALSAKKLDNSINAVINLKYSAETIMKVSESSLTILEVSRSKEDDRVKHVENSTMDWIVKAAYDKINKIPDVLWDAGEPEKEPMIRLFAKNASDLIKKINVFLNFTNEARGKA